MDFLACKQLSDHGRLSFCQKAENAIIGPDKNMIFQFEGEASVITARMVIERDKMNGPFREILINGFQHKCAMGKIKWLNLMANINYPQTGIDGQNFCFYGRYIMIAHTEVRHKSYQRHRRMGIIVYYCLGKSKIF